jgi:hypothetical protein
MRFMKPPVEIVTFGLRATKTIATVERRDDRDEGAARPSTHRRALSDPAGQ